MNTMKLSNFYIIIIILFCSNLSAQCIGSGGDRIEGDFKFLPIPYVNYDRSIGFQYGGIPMIQFNHVRADTLSPSSVAGLFGMYSTSKTYFIMGFSKLYFDEDNWRFTVAGGTGSVHFQFFIEAPIDQWIPYNTKMTMFFIEAQRRVYKRIYLGLSYVYIKFDTSTEITEGVFTNKLNGLGVKVLMDYRDNVSYPYQGYYNNLQLFSYPEFMGNEAVSNKIEISHNHFFPMRENEDVLAFRAYAGFGLGDLSFNQQFIVGRGDDLRGYTQGEYRGNNMAAIQGEYRWNIKDTRFGFVGFMGVVSVFDSINDEHNGKLLPGIGAGFRYTVSEETNMNVGMDIAKGDGDWGIYFRIGEAFNR